MQSVTTTVAITPTVNNQVCFVAGTPPGRIEFWKSLTNDSYVLRIIKGYELELDSIPRKNSYAGQYFNSTTSNDRLTRDTRSIGYGSD